MATLKLKFRPSGARLGDGILYYQVIYNRQSFWLSTGHRIYFHEWDEQAMRLRFPSEGKRNQELSLIWSSLQREMRQLTAILFRVEDSSRNISLDELRQAFREVILRPTVFSFLQEQTRRKECMVRKGTAKTYKNAYRRFFEFRQGVDLAFCELTSHMMEQYEAWLVNRGLMHNTIRFYLRTLNTMLRRAEDEGLLTDQKLFSHVRLSFTQTVKRALSEKDLRAIERLPLPVGSSLAFARDIFMFSFYMRGMPFVDIAFLKKSNLQNGTLGYCRRKTNQFLSIEWESVQQTIVNRYAHLTHSSSYMFPIITHEDGTEYLQYQRMQENVNRNLKKIGVRLGLKIPLTTYVARHTWASIARNMNVSIAVISEGMGHHSYKTTQIYLDTIDNSMINDANRRIIRRINRQ